MQAYLLVVAVAMFGHAYAAPGMPNIGFLGKGYDMFKACPRPTTTPVDPGFASPVFDMTKYTQNRLTADQQFSIPDNSAVVSCQACQLSMQVDVSETTEKYRESLNNQLSWGVGLEIPKIRDDEKKSAPAPVAEVVRTRRQSSDAERETLIKISFSGSNEVKKAYEQLNSKKEVYTEGVAACAAYCADLELYQLTGSSALTLNFINAIKSLSLTSDDSFYGVMMTFGTHFISSMKMGALYYQRQIFSQTTWSQMSESGEKDGFNFEANIVIIGGSYGESHDSYNYKYGNSTQKSQSFREFSLGAAPVKDVVEWQRLSAKTPMPYKFAIQPISALLTEVFFPGLADLAAKKTKFEKLINDGSYCNYILKARGETGNCQQYYSK